MALSDEINVLDLFTGIGGFSLAIEQAGYEIKEHYASEIEKKAAGIFKYHYPESINLGSVVDFQRWRLPRIHAITFGSPCQDFSIAGLRKGIDGQKSHLVWYAIECIRKFQPDFFIFENVEGLLSSNAGADFWAIIQAITNLGDYRIEWQLLNTAWFLPQNRSRLYVIGYHPNGCTGSVFPIRKGNSHDAKTRLESSGRLQVNCIDANYGKGPDGKRTMIAQRARGKQAGGSHDVCPTITSSRFEQNHAVTGALIRTRSNSKRTGVNDTRNGNVPALTASGRAAGHNHAAIGVRAVKTCQTNQNGRHIKKTGEPAFSLTVNNEQAVEINDKNSEKLQYRRLTELECELLQGFPAGWTEYGLLNGQQKKISATARYNCLGNAITVPVAAAVVTNYRNYMSGN